MNNFFDKADETAIETAINEGGNIWKSEHIEGVKRKIKNHYRTKQGEQCCYCRRSTQGEFNMVLDIEHILPKGKPEFEKYMFVLDNLSVSCKRCNMNQKNEKITFIADNPDFTTNPFDSKNYKFIHPNSDFYFDHIKYISKTVNNKSLIKYKIISKSKKGAFTYDFFTLENLEKDSFDQAQGAKLKSLISEVINPKTAEKIKKLFKLLNPS